MSPEGNGNPPKVALRTRIRTHRRGMDLNQTEYGRRYGVGQITVSNWEKGVFRPDQEHMDLLRADGLDSGDIDSSGEGPRQLDLPFEQAFLLEMRIGPQMAGSVGVRFRVRRLVN